MISSFLYLSIPVYLRKVMDRAVEEQLNIDLLFPRKVNLSSPRVEQILAKTGSTIASLMRRYFLFHLFGEALRFSLEEIDLPSKVFPLPPNC